MHVEEYVALDGRNRYREWFNDLSPYAAAKVATAVVRMASGNTSGLKSLGSALFEWRIDWGPGLRIYVLQEGKSLIVLFGGGDKSDQRAQIEAATNLVVEYKRRKTSLRRMPASGRPTHRSGR
jgi:putative addiction module killer protein